MTDLTPFNQVALVGVAILVPGWILAVVLKPGPARDKVGWVGATALYLALSAFFLGHCLRFWEEGRWALLIPIGFLAFMFSVGLLVSSYRTIAQFVGRTSASQSATN